MGFSRQEYRGGLPLPSPGDHLNPGAEPGSPELAGRDFTTEPPDCPKEQYVFIKNPTLNITYIAMKSLSWSMNKLTHEMKTLIRLPLIQWFIYCVSLLQGSLSFPSATACVSSVSLSITRYKEDVWRCSLLGAGWRRVRKRMNSGGMVTVVSQSYRGLGSNTSSARGEAAQYMLHAQYMLWAPNSLVFFLPSAFFF